MRLTRLKVLDSREYNVEMMMMTDWCYGSFSGGIDQVQLRVFPGLVS